MAVPGTIWVAAAVAPADAAVVVRLGAQELAPADAAVVVRLGAQQMQMMAFDMA